MKKTILTGLVVVLLGVAGAGAYIVQRDDNAANVAPEASQSTQQADTTNNEALLIQEEGKVVSYDGEEGISALVTLKSLATVTTDMSDFGEFVTSINGVSADGSTEFWGFYVNGEMAKVGAGSYIAKAGDAIEWRIEKVEQ